ncbi:MAG TPA: hypothetical protein VM452_14505, partial [Caulifigura sp.]|nr:hypothetical protein [Caulifigura sp.]
MALNRRSFVGAFTAGIAALSITRRASAAELKTVATGVPSASGADPVRIMSNENPLGPSPRALDAAMRSCAGANRYARNESRQLDSLLRTRFGLPPAPPREPNSPD